jgi:PH/SEC7 domain-containing protein
MYADACHTITCAMLLLNTDLHGQNIGKKMTVDKFIKNLDGLNDGRNFDRADLTRIYKSIRSEPLPLPRSVLV